MKKIILTAQELLDDSYRLGMQVIESKYEPTFLVALWRGGGPIGIAIHELLSFYKFKVNHAVLKTSSYKNFEQSNQIYIDDMSNLIKNISQQDRVLFIDDIFDTGRTYAAIIEALVDNCGANLPNDIRLAVPWYKPEKNKTKYTPDYFLHTTDKWIVFPHELDVLNDKELAIHRPGIKKLE